MDKLVDPSLEVLDSATFRVQTECGSLYITFCIDDEGKPKRIFFVLGKSGGCQSLFLRNIASLITRCFEHEILGLVELAASLKGHSCINPTFERGVKKTCQDKIADVLTVIRRWYLNNEIDKLADHNQNV